MSATALLAAVQEADDDALHNDGPCCNAWAPSKKAVCTRADGHDWIHVAASSRRVLERWENDERAVVKR